MTTLPDYAVSPGDHIKEWLDDHGINAAELALAGAPERAKVSLDAVIRTLRETAEAMSDRFKETSQGGLATNVSVRFTEC